MTLTSKKLLPLLLYILLMQGCICLPATDPKATPAIVPPPTSANETSDNARAEVVSSPHGVVGVAKAETLVSDINSGSPGAGDSPAPSDGKSKADVEKLGKDAPCFAGSNKFGGVKYYYRRHQGDKNTDSFFNQLSHGEKLSTGDWYFVRFVPDADCYVYVFQVAETGIFDLIKKSAWSHEKIFKRGKKYSLPSDEDEDAFKLQEGNGQETIYVLASKERDQELEDLYEKFSKASENKEQDQISKLRTDLLTQLQTRKIFKLIFQHQAPPPPVVPTTTDENKVDTKIHNQEE